MLAPFFPLCGFLTTCNKDNQQVFALSSPVFLPEVFIAEGFQNTWSVSFLGGIHTLPPIPFRCGFRNHPQGEQEVKAGKQSKQRISRMGEASTRSQHENQARTGWRGGRPWVWREKTYGGRRQRQARISRKGDQSEFQKRVQMGDRKAKNTMLTFTGASTNSRGSFQILHSHLCV